MFTRLTQLPFQPTGNWAEDGKKLVKWIIEWRESLDRSGTLAFNEYGTWTPTDTSGAGLALTVTKAKYIRQPGRAFTLYMDITYPVTADVSNAQIGGMPLTEADKALGAIFTDAATGASVAQVNGAAMNFYTVAGAPKTNAQLSGAIVRVTVHCMQ